MTDMHGSCHKAIKKVYEQVNHRVNAQAAWFCETSIDNMLMIDVINNP